MISLGNKFPPFNKTACVSTEKGKEFEKISSEDHISAGKWMVMFWYPKDFTFICPVEITEFNSLYEEFEERETLLYGASTDSEYSHLAWRKNHSDLKELKFPLIADTSKSLAEALEILEPEEKIANRVTYIVDPEGIIRWVCANDIDIGRNVNEVIRVLDALQSIEKA